MNIDEKLKQIIREEETKEKLKKENKGICKICNCEYEKTFTEQNMCAECYINAASIYKLESIKQDFERDIARLERFQDVFGEGTEDFKKTISSLYLFIEVTVAKIKEIILKK